MNGEPQKPTPAKTHDGMLDSVRRARQHSLWRKEGEPSTLSFVGQIGVLGWIIVTPILVGLFIGRWLELALKQWNFLECTLDARWRWRRLLVGLEMDASAMSVLSNSQILLIATEIIVALVAGTGIGFAHFGLLRRNVDLIVVDGSVGRAIALHLARFAVTGVALYCAARFGALPLVAVTIGLLAGRQIAMRPNGGVR